MTSIGLYGLRGGVGVSSLLAALGYALHTLGERVLLIDMCPENLLRLHFNLPWPEQTGWAHALMAGSAWQEQAWRLKENLALLPYGRLDAAEQHAVEQKLLLEPELWSQRQASLADHFDWLLFDLPQRLPGHSRIGHCDLAIQVAQPDAACHALLQQQPAATDARLLVNCYDPGKQLQRDLMLLWRDRYSQRLLPLTVHADAAMPEALAHKMPIGRYAAASQAAQNALSLATWCLTQRTATA